MVCGGVFFSLSVLIQIFKDIYGNKILFPIASVYLSVSFPI